MKAIVAGGGTGGHIYPALSLAQRLKETGSVTMLARADSLEERVYRTYGLDVCTIDSAPLIFTPRRLGRFFSATIRGIRAARALIRLTRPQILVGTGGYVSAPAILAALSSGVPVYLLEQNSVMGRANRLFSLAARRVFLGFPITGSRSARFLVTGNPLRSDMYAALRESRHRTDRTSLLFLGGSGGALFINDLFLRVLEVLERQETEIGISIVTGEDDYERVAGLVSRLHPRHVTVVVLSYEEHMERLYADARLAVSRGGALALTELVVGGIYVFCIPFPDAVGHHQSRNAAFIEQLGLGKRLEQSDFRFDDFMVELQRRLDEPPIFPADPAGVFSQDAAQVICQLIEEDISDA